MYHQISAISGYIILRSGPGKILTVCFMERNIYSDLPRRLRTDGALSEIAAAWFIPFLHDRGCNIDIYCFCSHPESWWFMHSVCNVLLWTKFICIDNEFLGFLQDIMHCINLSPVNKSCKSTSKVLKCTRNVLKMKGKGLLMLWHIHCKHITFDCTPRTSLNALCTCMRIGDFRNMLICT